MPVIRQIKLSAYFLQIVIITLLMLVGKSLRIDPLFFGVFTYIILRLALGNLIPNDHRKGMSYYKKGQYKAAISAFQKSYDFFEKFPFLDRYRALTMLSASKLTYREMALINIAFSYTQIGDGIQARRYYEQAAKDYPKSQIALTALKMMDSVENKSEENE